MIWVYIRAKAKADQYQMLRKFNAVFVPNIVGIPDNDKEDAEKVMSQQR